MEAALFTLAASVLVLTVALVVLAGAAVTEFSRLARTRLGHELLSDEQVKTRRSEPVVDAAPPAPERPSKTTGYREVPADMDGA